MARSFKHIACAWTTEAIYKRNRVEKGLTARDVGPYHVVMCEGRPVAHYRTKTQIVFCGSARRDRRIAIESYKGK